MDERRRQSDYDLERFEEKIDRILETQSNMFAKQEVIKSKVERIEHETIKTNGRVSSLEEWKNIKNGQFSLICWVIGIIAAALAGAWFKVLF